VVEDKLKSHLRRLSAAIPLNMVEVLLTIIGKPQIENQGRTERLRPPKCHGGDRGGLKRRKRGRNPGKSSCCLNKIECGRGDVMGNMKTSKGKRKSAYP